MQTPGRFSERVTECPIHAMLDIESSLRDAHLPEQLWPAFHEILCTFTLDFAKHPLSNADYEQFKRERDVILDEYAANHGYRQLMEIIFNGMIKLWQPYRTRFLPPWMVPHIG